MMKRTDDYNDIIDMERPVSSKHPQMSLEKRAAQFAPFAALTGYEDAIEDTVVHHMEHAETVVREKVEE